MVTLMCILWVANIALSVAEWNRKGWWLNCAASGILTFQLTTILLQ